MADEPTFRFKCPKCGIELEVEAESGNLPAECPSCKKRIVIPRPVVALVATPVPVTPPVVPPPPPSVAPKGPVAQQAKRTSGLAVASLVMGILSVVFGPVCGGVIFSVLGLVFASSSMSQIKANPAELEGRGMAIAGLVTSIVGLATALLVVFFITLLGCGVAALAQIMHAMTLH